MRLVKVEAEKLEPGMFVAELDRPWLETPFALQGFVIQDPEEADYVANYVDHVYVDAEYHGSRESLALATAPTAPRTNNQLTLKDDFGRTQVSFDRATEALEEVFSALLSGEVGDVNTIHAAVKPLIEGVFRNPDAVAALLRQKEPGDYRYQHGIAMAAWATILGRQAGLRREELEKLAVGCALCDVGMTGLPPELLDQAENLTDSQRRIIRAHPKIGAEIVAASQNVDPEILGIIEYHHERVDGSGYPHGLQGADVPLLARIAGLVDTYDAMITPRPYSKARTSHEAMQELIDQEGTHFQQALVEQFVQAIGLYPTGSMVELNSGEVAVVIAQNASRRLKPLVLVILDSAKQRRDTGELLDLSDQQVAASGERWIVRELHSGSYGVSSEEYFV